MQEETPRMRMQLKVCEETKKDERIILLGEDIKINVWTVTRGLVEEFGD